MPELNRFPPPRRDQDPYISGHSQPEPEDYDDGRAPEPGEKKPGGWQLAAVQSIVCVVFLLVALVFRFIGGTSFGELRQSFNKSIMSNSFIATLAALWDAPNADKDSSAPEPSGSTAATEPAASGSESTASGTDAGTGTTGAPDESDTPAGGDDAAVDVKQVLYAPEGASFAPLTVNRQAEKPLASGTVTSYFGYRIHPVSGKESFHLGLDIAAPKDTPISSLFFGVVSEVGYSEVHGHYIKLYHGSGIEVMYAHCSEVLVAEGVVVRAGEIVAHVGSTGVSTGNHLHIEIRKNGVAHDPTGIVSLSWYD